LPPYRRVLQDINLGFPRDEALQSMSQRTDVTDLRLFSSAVTQASRYGISIADVMRSQSAELREKRKFRAEERAMKIPVKIVVPLVLCILPVLFIVLIGPGILRIADAGLAG
ncbi:MAG: type II secretion system F family protein, partial [Acidobacteria bacterium]|nr:type II secretion system F family protein [Acidobacteriota bacterium]